jgi:hypothetical protein
MWDLNGDGYFHANPIGYVKPYGDPEYPAQQALFSYVALYAPFVSIASCIYRAISYLVYHFNPVHS